MQVNVSVMLAKLLIGYAPSRTTDSIEWMGHRACRPLDGGQRGKGLKRGVHGKQRRNRDVSISSIL